MMYNDVDSDLPPFNDPIDGDEIFLFSNTKTTTSTGVGGSGGASFLHEDDDDHLRHQSNVVAGTSSHHLPVDVDELLLNSNFLEQPNCDTTEDPLFWNCKDISDDQLNEIWPQSQLNLSGNNISTINSINNINQHTINATNTNLNNTCLNPGITLTAATSLSNCSNNNDTQQNGLIINHQQHTHLMSQIQQHSQQTIIPIQHQQLHGISTLISQPQIINQQQPQHIQVRLHQQQHQNQHQQQQHDAVVHHQQAFNNVIHSHQQQSTPQLDQQGGFQQPHQIIQHLDQYQNKWITVFQTNDHYQTFSQVSTQDQQLSQQQQQVAQFFERLPQVVPQIDTSAPMTLCSDDSVITSTAQPQISLQIQPQQSQQSHPQQQQLQLQQPLIVSTPEQSTPPLRQEPVENQQQQQQSSTSDATKDKDKDDAKSEPEISDASKKDAQAKLIKPKERQTRLDCPYCKRSFCKNFDLQQHMRCHTGEKPFQCIVCGRGFAQKSNVKKHMQAHKVWPEGPNNPSMPPNHSSARSRNNSASSSLGLTRDDECMQENESIQINSTTTGNIALGNALGPSNDRKNDGNDIFAENRYSCSYCQFNGKTYFELKSHLTLHKREKVFKCIVSSCGKTFSGNDLQSFLDHVTGHKDLIYHCHLCSGQFYSLDEFGEHQKHHSNAQIKKSAQSQSSQSNQTQQGVQAVNRPTNTSLRQQNQQVPPTNQLQPQQNQRQYNQHSSSTNQQQQSSNQQQQQQTASLPTLQQTHQLQPMQPQQQAQQNQPSNLKAKIVNNIRPTLKNNQKYFRCSKCMNRYTTQTALDHHLSISTHNFPCTECNKVFMCERYLRRHLNTHTTVQHVCSFCDKQFKTAAYLKMHSVVHTGEKPFRCNQCEAAFNRRDKLSRHKLTHETVKKFKCPFKLHIGCTKEFNRPDKLKAHVLTHSGVRPHPCDSCSRTFSRLSRLREHKKLHHDMIDKVNLKLVNTTMAATTITPSSTTTTSATTLIADDTDKSKQNDANNNSNDVKLESVEQVV